ncbi:hypothetical protein JX265_002148 [Neoarthrinium moseri]|uniref:Uncharacterized protein n=1 Tax=Neoarthrinium moseri TaxID=1658444 RepID=A0A9Q0ASS2_9PEZI|nr:hypothetical protein JX265_002148 [Neoarthrinium moseri]
MVSQSTIAAITTILLGTNILVAAAPAPSFNETELVARMDANTASCENTWEHVTNDPVVQYWYLVVPNSGVKANRMWNHLNLNGCAPTEHKYYNTPKNHGVALTFHTSEACTAARVSHAYRSSSDPPYNLGCTFNGKESPNGGEAGAAAIDAAFEAVIEGIRA